MSSSGTQTTKVKLFKLWVHQENFSEDDLVLNPKEFPNIKEGDILEIYHAGEDDTRLLLQMKSISSDFQQRDTISIQQWVANFFRLRTYWDVQVRKVDPDSVTLDLVELIVKDLYLSRSEMWRLNKAITGSCVCVTKKLFHCGVRAQVNELWSRGQQVSCGFISEDTKVIFRSSTAMVYLLIQMSQEMWNFDLHGDLYFEKTVNGFLYELFSKWKELKTNHEVTIVLFSRTYYEAHSLDDFPEGMRTCIQQDPYSRFYEDFYQVVTHGDRQDDWVSLLVTLKKCISQYPRCSSYESVEGMPSCRNSLAFEGNFLEAINLTMNLFERHHVDRIFDRTGQTTVLVTPGSGMFEVDRNLTSITKQRCLDSGVAVDLVCMAEQPLHTVPLLKFYNKNLGGRRDLGDDYNIPHWMNHSFYASPKARSKSGKFMPRIKVPEIVLNYFGKNPKDNPHTKGLHRNIKDLSKKPETILQVPDFVDYDAYDAKVFKSSALKTSKKVPIRTVSSATAIASRYGSSTEAEKLVKLGSREDASSKKSFPSPPVPWPMSGDCAVETRSTRLHEQRGTVHILSSSVEQPALPLPMCMKGNATRQQSDSHESRQKRFTVGSTGALDSLLTTGNAANQLPRRQRTLINPFRPNVMPCRWICNRHRWAHAFPKGPHGEIVRSHYTKEEEVIGKEDSDQEKSCDVEQAARAVVAARKYLISEASGVSDEHDDLDGADFKGEDSDESSHQLSPLESESRDRAQDNPTPLPRLGIGFPRRRVLRPTHLALSKAPVEQDWTAAVKTSVDWKSLTIPACLPLTSDFYPDKRTLDSEYLEYNYEIYAEEDMYYGNERKTSQGNAELESIAEEDGNGERRTMTAEEVFVELVSQRLSKGFQLITAKEKVSPDKRQSTAAIPFQEDGTKEYFLSLGRNSHKLSLLSPQITVKGYRPRYPYHAEPLPYRYRLWMSQHNKYEPNQVQFAADQLDKYNWNYLDQHISNNREFSEMLEALKYWKARFLLLPMAWRKTSGEHKIVKTEEEWRAEGLLRFIEALNRIKRPNVLNQTKGGRATSGTSRSKARIPASGKQNKRAVRDSASSVKSLEPNNTEGRASPTRENFSEQPNSAGDESAVNLDDDMLSVQSPLESIVEAMMDSGDGMNFLPSMTSLESFSFLSIEASQWLMQNVDGVNSRSDAVQLGQKMLEAKLIHHASGSNKQRFTDGFFIFVIAPKSTWSERKEETSEKSRYYDRHRSQFARDRYETDLLESFQINWFEVAISFDSRKENDGPLFLSHDHLLASFPAHSLLDARRAKSWRTPLLKECSYGPAYKSVNIDSDPQRKSDRQESCTVRYHGTYHPAHAFEIEVHWIVATGCIVSDLVQTWARRAPSSGFHLVPVPVSPFPDPVGDNVDPFRLPIFIPLCVRSLCADGPDELFKEFDPSTRNQRMFFFQEAILRRFGFLKDSPYGPAHIYTYVAPPVQSRANDYVHKSGAAFARIPVWNDEEATSPYRASFSRSAFEQTQPEEDVRTRLPPPSKEFGFYWINNHMLTKRWRSTATGDVDAVVKLKSEFERFCRNENGTLAEFWDSCLKTSLGVSETRELEQAQLVGRGSGDDCERAKENDVTVEQEICEDTKKVSTLICE